METLQLFRLDPAAAKESTRDRRSANGLAPSDATWHEVELFLADRLERDGDLAVVQVALTLCDVAGERDLGTLEELTPDLSRFPRSAHAITRVIALLQLPVAERPEGFWPRFLLDQFRDGRTI